jgi:hypothetical protein
MKFNALLVLLTLWVPVAWCSNGPAYPDQGNARCRRFHCRNRAATLNRNEGIGAIAVALSNRAS